MNKLDDAELGHVRGGTGRIVTVVAIGLGAFAAFGPLVTVMVKELTKKWKTDAPR